MRYSERRAEVLDDSRLAAAAKREYSAPQAHRWCQYGDGPSWARIVVARAPCPGWNFHAGTGPRPV